MEAESCRTLFLIKADSIIGVDARLPSQKHEAEEFCPGHVLIQVERHPEVAIPRTPSSHLLHLSRPIAYRLSTCEPAYTRQLVAASSCLAMNAAAAAATFSCSGRAAAHYPSTP